MKLYEKFIASLLIVVMLFNFTFAKPVEAADGEFQAITQGGIQIITSLGDGILGVLFILPKLVAMLAIIVVMGLLSAIANAFGNVDEFGNLRPGNADDIVVTPDTIFFNKLLITDINIFNIDSSKIGTVSFSSAIYTMRSSIAMWYYFMRLISLVILLAILMYIAIRMAISTMASDKAKYKEMLFNWATSIALVFVLHYVIVVLCNLNSALVKMFAQIVYSMGSNGNLSDTFGDLMGQALMGSLVQSSAAIIVMFLIIAQTIAFFVYYVKRMLTVSFLIIISPLITITYSIDKLGDGKAQALNTWMKEFFFTVIIQPFHCVIYTVFVGLALSMMASKSVGITTVVFQAGVQSIISGVLAIMCIKFVWDAEKMIKNIFGIKVSSTLGDAVASAAIAGTLVNKGIGLAKDAGKIKKNVAKLGKYKGSFKESRKEMRNALSNSKVGKALKIKNSDEKVAEKKEKSIRKLAEERQRKFGGSSTSARAFAEQQYAANEAKTTAKKKAKEAKRADKEAKRAVRRENVNKFLNSETGQIFKRYVSSSTGVVAAMMAGAVTYGVSPKTSMLEAGIVGYGTGQGVKSAVNGLMARKSKDYIGATLDDYNLLCEIRNQQNTGDKALVQEEARSATTANSTGELNKIGEEADKALKAIEKLLEGNGKSTQENKNEAKIIRSAILNGIFMGDLNYEQIANSHNIADANLLRDATSKFAEMKVQKQMAERNSSIDTMQGEDNYFDYILRAWNKDTAARMGTYTPSGGNPQPANNNTQNNNTQNNNTQNNQPIPNVKLDDAQLNDIVSKIMANGPLTPDISKLLDKLEENLGIDRNDPDFAEQIKQEIDKALQEGSGSMEIDNLKIDRSKIADAVKEALDKSKVEMEQVYEHIKSELIRYDKGNETYYESMDNDKVYEFVQKYKVTHNLDELRRDPALKSLLQKLQQTNPNP